MIKEPEVTPDYFKGVLDVGLGLAFPWIDPDYKYNTESDNYARKYVDEMSDYPTAPYPSDTDASVWLAENRHLMSIEEIQIAESRIRSQRSLIDLYAPREATLQRAVLSGGQEAFRISANPSHVFYDIEKAKIWAKDHNVRLLNIKE